MRNNLTVMVPLSDIALTTRRAALHHDPFPFGWIDHYLPAPLYEALNAGFPSPDAHPGADTLGKGKKRIVFTVPPLPMTLGPMADAWTHWLAAIGSREFRAHCLAWAHQFLPLETLAGEIYRDLFRLRQALGPDDVEMQCEFSTMAKEVFLPPHSDSPDKILTCVHYYAPAGWDERWDGATEIYRPADPRHAVNFSNFFLTRDAVACVDRSAYRSNRLFFFVKNDRAWHGVAPLSPATALPRRSFNFSLRIKADRVHAEMAALEAAIRAAEQPAFA